MEQIGQNEADGSNVDVPHAMTADQTEHGADVGARTAAHATQGLRQHRILQHLATAVVKKNHMHDLAFFRSGRSRNRTIDPCHI